MRNDFIEICQNSQLPWLSLSGKTIVVTGANGLIASYLIRFLAYLNDEYLSMPIKIIAVSRNLKTGVSKFGNLIAKPWFELRLEDAAKVDVQKDPDLILHLASQASPKFFSRDPIDVIDSNVFGTRNMLKLAKRSGARMLFVSSGEVYGQPIKAGAISEADFGNIDLTDSRSCYAESKRCGEVLCVCASKQWGVDVRIARPFHSYGPGMDLLTDGRVFADFVKNVVYEEPIVMRSTGEDVRCFLYLSDLIQAFFYVLFMGKNGQAYNTAAEVGTSILDLAKTLCASYSLELIQKEIENKEYLKSKIHVSYANVEKLKGLGWQQRVGIKEGFDRTIKSYLSENE